MKRNLITLAMFLFTVIVYSQSLTATTKDGRTVILKENKTWEFSDKKEDKRKITLEFTSKNTKKQFQVVYDAPDSKMVDSGNMIGGFYNSGWKKSIFLTNEQMENQITLKVGKMGMGSETVTLNIYIDEKLVKTTTAKAKMLISEPATLTVDLSEYKN